MILAKHHKEWISIVKSFGAKQPQDVVQDFYLAANEVNDCKILKGSEPNRAYIWICLRNIYLSSIKNQRNDLAVNETLTEQTNIEQQIALDKIIEKVNVAKRNLHPAEYNLLTVYFTTNKSYRDIAKETGLSLRGIFNWIKNSKEVIKEEVFEDYLDYINGDYERI